MSQLNWDEFRRKNKNLEASFENLCYSLFCREYELSDGIFGYKNQTGIEREPVFVLNKFRGFQCKFYQEKFKWDKFSEGLDKAKAKNPQLQVYRVYCNQDFVEGAKQKKTKAQLSFEAKAKNLAVTVEYFVNSQFFESLQKPKNLDLAQLYFGASDEYGFILRSVNHRYQTLITSAEFINPPVEKDSKEVANVTVSIKRSTSKVHLFIGNPGSGKSCLMHWLFRSFAGLDKATENQMVSYLLKNGSVPILINLKSCTTESLDQIISRRQDESLIRNNRLQFVYILDGLDELSEDIADQTLSFVKELESLDRTSKVIISCRSGNLNRVKVKLYLGNVTEYKIKDLSYESTKDFFQAKGTRHKQKMLTALKRTNPSLVEGVKDILLIRLLWDTIEELNSSSSVADLMEKKVNLLLSNPEHKKNIDSLNLLDLKADILLEINREISYSFQAKYQYRFTLGEIQSVMLLKPELSRLSYKDINAIINYICNLFFDSSPGYGQSDSSFIYQHRRFQEFFFTQKLVTEYEKNPNVIRELNLLTNKKYFQDYFLKYTRSKYESSENLIGLLDLNFLDVYLGNHSGFGVDDAYHLNSSEFIPALINQPKDSLEEFLYSENFEFNRLLFIDLDTLKENLELWKKDPQNYDNRRHLESIWSYGFGSYIKNIITFWDSGKKYDARELAKNLNSAIDLYRESGFLSSKESEHLQEPFKDSLLPYINTQLLLKNRSASNILKKIRENYAISDNQEISDRRYIQGRQKFVSVFFSAVLTRVPGDLDNLVDTLDDFEFQILLTKLVDVNFIHQFISNPSLQAKIKRNLLSRSIIISEHQTHLAFYKKFFAIAFNEAELEHVESAYSKLHQEREVDWSSNNIPERIALLAYSLDKDNFALISTEKDDRFRYYSPLEIYAALFQSYLLLLNKKVSISFILREFIKYNRYHDQRTGRSLKYEIGLLWGLIFSRVPGNEISEYKRVKNVLFTESGFGIYAFIKSLKENSSDIFESIITLKDLKRLDNVLVDTDSFQELVDNCFSLSILYSTIDSVTSRNLFTRGLREAVLRHGWRKDPIVSYFLVDSLEVLWRNDFCNQAELKRLTRDVFNLGIRVSNFTEDAGDGPYNVISLVAQYDIEFAEELKKELVKDNGYRGVRNSLITSILMGKIQQGFPYYDIEDGMSEYRKNTDYVGVPRADSYEEKIKVLLTIAESEFYDDEEQRNAFLKAYSLVEDMKSDGVKYYLSDTYHRDVKIKYIEFCKKYSKEVNIETKEERDHYKDFSVEYKVIEKKIRNINSLRELKLLYKRLNTYKRGIIIKDYSNWKLLVEKTIEYSGGISLLIKLLQDSSFPNTDRYNVNSKNLHYALAAAISDISFRKDIYSYLGKSSGRGGFYNMIKVYEVLNDREMCVSLFNRFLQLCHLISDEVPEIQDLS